MLNKNTYFPLHLDGGIYDVREALIKAFCGGKDIMKALEESEMKTHGRDRVNCLSELGYFKKDV